VDDNLDSAESLSSWVGNEFSSAYDGQQALEMAKELRPDVVLLDLGLPKLNGYEVAKQIRLEPWGHKTILIAITGWGQAEDKELSREAGFDNHLVKPVDPDTLLKLINKRRAAHSSISTRSKSSKLYRAGRQRAN